MSLNHVVTQLSAHPWAAFLTLSIVFPAAFLIHDVWLWRRLPPGPMPLPFIGNQLDVPKSKPWLQFHKWSKRYGPIFTVWLGRTPTIVISDPEIANDLLEKRGVKYSSRPRLVIMGELYNESSSILTQPYNQNWSTRRRLLHQALTPKALELYKPIQEAEATRLCFALWETSNWEREIERFAGSVVFCIAYGHRVDSLDSKVIRDRFRFMHNMSSLNIPGQYLAETFPLLAKIPAALAPWKRKVQEMGGEEVQANINLVRRVKDEIANRKSEGTAVPDSLCKLALELCERDSVQLSDKHFSYIPASLFSAGSETTTSSIISAVLAFVTHPHVQERARSELDAVVGAERMPTFDDKPNLPYMHALCKEVHRWRAIAVMGGTPHASSEDDTYMGYYIPARTNILGNSWAINLNEDYYPQPHVFDPVRFLSTEELDAMGLKQPYAGVKVHPAKSGHSSFGWGRRICPGADLATNSIFVVLAKLLWAYNFSPSGSYDTLAYTDSLIIRPQKFECEIKVRSEHHLEVLKREQTGSTTYLENFTPFAD